jgi:hypothetical protein
MPDQRAERAEREAEDEATLDLLSIGLAVFFIALLALVAAMMLLPLVLG